jgi:hypothetical protein
VARRRYLRLKEHTHTFVNEGGHLGELDFRFPIGAPISGLNAFARTQQLGVGDKLANALRLGTSPIVAALVNFDVGMDMVRAAVVAAAAAAAAAAVAVAAVAVAVAAVAVAAVTAVTAVTAGKRGAPPAQRQWGCGRAAGRSR